MLKAKVRSALHNKALLAILLVAALLVAAFGIVQAMSIGTYDQCSNDDGDGYATGDTGCRWINGNLNANNSTYFEGDSTVQRLWLTGFAPGSSHTVKLKYGTTKSGKHAYDFLTTWDWSEDWVTVDDRCQDITGCTTTAETKLAIPVDPNALGYDAFIDLISPRNFVMRGGTLNSATIPTTVSGDYTGDSETVITVSFTVAPSGAMCTTAQGVTTCGVALWFGAHVATQTDWGLNNGASSISGSPYHVALDQVDGASVGQRDNQMQANAVVPDGKITIVKDAQPNDAQAFDFALTNQVTLFKNFSLADNPVDPTAQSTTTYSVPPGTYNLWEENIPDTWFLANLVCVDPTNDTTWNLGTGEAVINLASAETVVCTYTNTQYALIIVRKVTIPPNAAHLFTFDLRDGNSNVLIPPSDMTPPANPFTRSAQQVAGLSIQVKPGQFKLSELYANLPNDWTLIDVLCTGNNVSGSNWAWSGPGDVDVAGNLGAAMIVDCTFTNKAGPNAVTLASFSTTVQSGDVVLDWETVSDSNIRGFNVYRGGSDAGPWAKLNDAEIASPTAGSTTGNTYTFTDTTAEAGATYWYQLEDVTLSGATATHPPMMVVVNAPTAVRLAGLGAAPALSTAVPLAAIGFALLTGFAAARRRR
jgi:hypothetical protein